MKQFSFKVPIYDWEVFFALIEQPRDAEPLEDLLRIKMGASGEALKQEINYVEKSFYGGGDTWRDFDTRRAVVVIFPWKDKLQLIETLNHEKRHLIDRILQWAHIDDLEAAAFLDGYISKQIFTHINKTQDLL